MRRYEKMVTLNGNNGNYEGESSDVKPTLTDKYEDRNIKFVELDTGIVYYWNGTQWKKFGGD